jgi:hypothetical protein
MSYSRLHLALKASLQLPPQQLIQFALYRLSTISGWMRFQTSRPPYTPVGLQPTKQLFQPDLSALVGLLTDKDQAVLLAEADLIVGGKAHLFGAPAVSLDLIPPPPLKHWTELEGRIPQPAQDIKLIWEPARFGWACTLARARLISGNASYTDTFWDLLELFLSQNPAYLGWNWLSAQEAALRIIVWAFVGSSLDSLPETTPQRKVRLARAIAQHAQRIPPSLAYARAQNNNHLLSEAAGLYTAGSFLPEHPLAGKWRELGWRWFERGILSQVSPDGSYIQHSTNYHRLMLQLAVWMQCLAQANGTSLNDQVLDRLGLATRWLLNLADLFTGRVPNLGPNDGAYVLPLSVLPFYDYRPTLQSAARLFLGLSPFHPGAWDEMGLWLGINSAAGGANKTFSAPSGKTTSPLVLQHPHIESWVYLRAAQFSSRPGHADQLHLDLWHHGENVAIDAGTYHYTAPQPWANPLVHTAVHNTITINETDQMTPAGRFLFLDWAQAELMHLPEAAGIWAAALHTGYHQLGITHQRKVYAIQYGWIVEDDLSPNDSNSKKHPVLARLHWLLTDGKWAISGADHLVPTALKFELHTSTGKAILEISACFGENKTPIALSAENYSLVRAGEVLSGTSIHEATRGWYSPTYTERQPALSLAVQIHHPPPIYLTTRWQLESNR